MFEELIAKISAALDRFRIPYMIIGGQAVLLYGEPRLTRDIDITLGVDIAGFDTILAVVVNLSLRPLPENLQSFVEQTMVLPALDEATGVRVDFIFSFTPFETEAIRRARKINLMDQAVSFASPEDVIIHKVFAGRPRDLEDVKSILLKNPDIDIRYIRKWLKEFDESSDEKIFLRVFEEIIKTSAV